MIDSRSNTIPEHKPVMVSEVVSCLLTDLNGIYVDGTIGLGGHSLEILSILNRNGHVIGIDRDIDAVSKSKTMLSQQYPNCSIFNGSYANVDTFLAEFGVKTVNGILLDLGLSSAQLNNKNRGFTYNGVGTLDMRFNQQSRKTAAEILASSSESEIADFIYKYSEERFSRKIAYNIKKADKMETVDDLIEAIRKSTPPNKRNRSKARVFQAIRIIVNDELAHLELFLGKFTSLLCEGGRIVIMSYHSLEDRLVKIAFKKLNAESKLLILTKRPIIATSDEIIQNSRAKSAKLRAGERI